MPPVTVQSSPPTPDRVRVPLGTSRRRLSYDLRLRLALVSFVAPTVVCAGLLGWRLTESWMGGVFAAATTALVEAAAAGWLYGHVTRPLQTLSNVVAALHEEDFSFRARGARRGDSLGDLALEVNSLAGTLQNQRNAARDALTLAERVMQALRAPVLAFTPDGRLRLVNPAAEAAFSLSHAAALGATAEALGFANLLELHDGDLYVHAGSGPGTGETRWSLRRSGFRLGGLPHSLFVLADVDAALREKERVAWQRLVRVLSHEINNSLTPITSLAGSLRGRLPAPGTTDATLPRADLSQMHRGLRLIESRAVSLHRFVEAYGQLTRLPRPTLQPTLVVYLVQRVAALSTRVAVALHGSERERVAEVPLDPAQVEQLLINLLRNAAEASLMAAESERLPSVELSWFAEGEDLVLRVEDNGPGLPETANLFVPFYTTKPGGSGIGLVLAKQIAQGHRGSLSLINREGNGGCRAELRIPLRPADPMREV